MKDITTQHHKSPQELQNGKTFVEWHAPEFIAPERTQQWYLLWLLGALAVITISVIFKNILFAILILLTAIAVLLQSQRTPKIITCAITSRGVRIGERQYKFDDIESFWIIYEPPHTKVLLLSSKQMLNPQIAVEIAQENPVRIRQALLQFLPEKEQRPSFIDWLTRILKL